MNGGRRRWLLATIGVAVLAGCFFRLYNIDRKVFWDDEIYTSLRVLGDTESEWVGRTYQIVDAEGLRSLLHPPASVPKRSVAATIDGLVSEDPQHSPLYYIAGYYWVRVFGDSTIAMRSLSVVFGLLALPAGYWLCMELFGSAAAARLGLALFALSPVLVLYSQEAREYSLLALAMFLMCAAFLRAVRRANRASWALYAVLLTFALYVSSVAASIALGQLAYLVLARAGGARLRAAVAASALAAIGFVPWLVIMITHSEQIRKAWATVTTPKFSAAHIARWFVGNLRHNFIDLNLLQSARWNVLASLPVVLLIGYAVYYVSRRGKFSVWGYLASIAIFSTAPVVLPDLFFTGERTANARYFLPLYVTIDLAVVYLIAMKTAAGTDFRRRRAWQAVFGIILAARFVSCAASSQAETWWNKLDQKSIAVARVINQADRPLLISDNYLGWALSLSNYLDDKVRIELRPRCYLCSRSAGWKLRLDSVESGADAANVFLLGPSEQLQTAVIATMGPGMERRYRCIDVRNNCSSELKMW